MSGVRCDICPHNCQLKEGQVGICGVRSAKNEEVTLLTYGKFSAINLDPIEKKPLYHVDPGSATLSLGSIGCNLRCPWCQNYTISQTRDFNYLRELSIDDLISLVKENSYKSVTFTYNEPIISYEYVVEASKALKECGIDTNIVTAGYINHSKLKSFFRNIRAVNVDLKAFNPNTYKKLIQGDIKPVLETLKFLCKSDTWLEITTLLIPEVNDSKKEITELVNWIYSELGDSIPLHFSGFYPTYHMNDRERTPLKTIIMARDIALKKGLKYVYTGNVVNIEGSTTFCPSCSTSLIKREGYTVNYNNIINSKCKNCGRAIEGIFK